ncbi:DNA-binding response regulator [Pseudarthrobacter phenanthrenivorans]|uniref:DNA-binding response regulator n=2 Tax=Pseudarthrobacter phenanthrenivorans TaxID=361575 RepID=A0A3B0FZD1_PSEPS|nr:response regulator with CheY-like receiver domain and winged-helix DNA-binding domain [Pseudarthrobacter phenanthrenivorans Sphe3]RKO23677.1 DNA-binding response regulator [Pseudarthrobacter phenanthrenivorans]TPV50561.1 response regulator transcription factor [Pseudarthrobacter phenanthrenivorans]
MISPSGPRRAVVIEDDADIRGLLVRVLGKQGFDVTHAEAALPGVEEARRTRPHLVTLDLNLPDNDGLEACRLLRGFSDAVIVVLTARESELDRLASLEAGADAYFSKPFSPKELQSGIDAIFNRRFSAAASPT